MAVNDSLVGVLRATSQCLIGGRGTAVIPFVLLSPTTSFPTSHVRHIAIPDIINRDMDEKKTQKQSKLSPEQEREVLRLVKMTHTPVSSGRRRMAIYEEVILEPPLFKN